MQSEHQALHILVTMPTFSYAERLKLEPNDMQQFFDTDLKTLFLYDGKDWRPCGGK